MFSFFSASPHPASHLLHISTQEPNKVVCNFFPRLFIYFLRWRYAFLMTPVKRRLRCKGEKKNHEGQMQRDAEMETEDLIKLIHLAGYEGRERQAERNFTLADLSQHTL